MTALHSCLHCSRHPATHGPTGDDRCGACGLGDAIAEAVDLVALVRDLRDVGTDAIHHSLMGACPNVSVEGPDTASDRDHDCKACAVLVRADAYLATVGP